MTDWRKQLLDALRDEVDAWWAEQLAEHESAGVEIPDAARPEVTWRELKEALRPLKAFADQDEIALGAAADAVLALLNGSAS